MASAPDIDPLTPSDAGRGAASSFRPAVRIQHGSIYTLDSGCWQCARHIALLWRIRDGELLAALPLADQTPALRADRQATERAQAEERTLRWLERRPRGARGRRPPTASSRRDDQSREPGGD